MVCDGPADVTLQEEGHFPARTSGQQSSLRISGAAGKSVMNGSLLIRTVMAPQAIHRE